jgi:hypothetical protein
MMIGLSLVSGYEAMIVKPLSISRSWFEMPMRTRPSTYFGEPFAWKATKSSGVPVSPFA